MGTVVKKTRRMFSQLLAIVGIAALIYAAVIWGEPGGLTVGSTGHFASGISSFLGNLGITTLNYWSFAILGAGCLFMAYVFDSEAAGEVVGIPYDVAEDVIDRSVGLVATTTSSIFEKFNFKELALAAGGVYLLGKVLTYDNDESGSNITLDLGDDRSGKGFVTEGSNGGPNGSGSVLPGDTIQQANS